MIGFRRQGDKLIIWAKWEADDQEGKNTRSVAFNYMQHEGGAGLCRACGVKEGIGTGQNLIPLKPAAVKNRDIKLQLFQKSSFFWRKSGKLQG